MVPRRARAGSYFFGGQPRAWAPSIAALQRALPSLHWSAAVEPAGWR